MMLSKCKLQFYNNAPKSANCVAAYLYVIWSISIGNQFFFGTLLMSYLYFSVFGHDTARKMIEIIENDGRECRMENGHDEGCCVKSIKIINFKTTVHRRLNTLSLS